MKTEVAHPAGESPQDDQKSLATLVKDLTQEATTLFRQEIELAKAELAQKAKKAGLGAGLFGGATVLGLGAFGALTACLILALAIVLPATVAAILVAAVYAAGAAVLALRGKQQIKEATPPAPEQAVESVKEDVAWLKNRKSSEAG